MGRLQRFFFFCFASFLTIEQHGVLEYGCLQCGVWADQREAVLWIEAEKIERRTESQRHANGRINSSGYWREEDKEYAWLECLDGWWFCSSREGV